MIESNFEDMLELDEPIELFLSPTPDGCKIAIMLAELAVPHTANIVADAEETVLHLGVHDDAPIAGNPLPAIVDPEGPDGNPLVLFETGAILRYLARKYAGLYPTNERHKAEVDQWLFWSEATLQPLAAESLRLFADAAHADSAALDRNARAMHLALSAFDRRLQARTFIAGAYSIADVSAFPWLRKVGEIEQDFARYKNIFAWLERISSRPEVRHALAVMRGPSGGQRAGANATSPSASPATGSDQSSDRLSCDTP